MEEDVIGGLDASVANFVLSPVDTAHKTDFSLVGHSPGSFVDDFDDNFVGSGLQPRSCSRSGTWKEGWGGVTV